MPAPHFVVRNRPIEEATPPRPISSHLDGVPAACIINSSLSIQGSGQPPAKFIPAQPLTTVRFPFVSQADFVCDGRPTGWDFRSGLVDVGSRC